MEFFSKGKIYHFMKYSRYFVTTTLILAAISIGLIVTKGFNYGIDFVGGTVVQLKYDQAAPIEKIRESIAHDKVLAGALITEFGSPEEIVMRFSNVSDNLGQDVGDHIRSVLKNTGNFDIRKVDIVGPKIGSELREKGIISAILAVISILIYVAIRFEWKFAIASIITLVHDITITLGAIILFDIEFSLDALAAVLTLIGYSLNDTIIIFDRIREELAETKNMDFHEIIDICVSKTLSRTTITSLLVFFVVLTLYIFGGEIIHGFSFTMLLGVVIGTYSSIFISAPFLTLIGFSIEAYKERLALKEKHRIERTKMRSQYEKGTV
ncbi:protein translocase subunit SecF [Sulfurospirillum cavolei]|uniref:protein translocase subunit SecF n=1 Tax=Sulfurospirillum cavolei TaxID=366522 RepID=UPI003FA31F9A